MIVDIENLEKRTNSIARVELKAGVMGVKLATHIADALQVPTKSITYHTDSLTVMQWLRQPVWPRSDALAMTQECLEAKKVISLATVTESLIVTELFKKNMHFWKNMRILSYILRMNTRKKADNKDKDYTTLVSRSKSEQALQLSLRVTQMEEYPEEFQALQKGQSIKRSSKLIDLNPYFDQDMKLLRVGAN
eukprot:TCALIF_13178-PA protein Name:"Protein of unknown function" AED:0.33 eAED:0.35 QI:0/-1/0/1/-1/1/1/0/191